MNVASDVDTAILHRVVRRLEDCGKGGMALSSLAAFVKLLHARLEQLLERNSDWFVRVGPTSNYSLNGFRLPAGSG